MDINLAYKNTLQRHKFKADPAQKKVVAALQHIQQSLLNENNNAANRINKLIRQLIGNTKPITGLYLWGDVGRGKTWLMNLFMDSLAMENKKRLHFHHFMIGIHAQLASMPQQKNPLKKIAKDFSDKYQVLCLDEFIVTNITDAMLLYGLLEALFENGVTLIATSNRIPEHLYKNGLQRERFLPAIDLINQHTHVLHLNGEKDHRLALLEKSNVFLTPITRTTHQQLYQQFVAMACDTINRDQVIKINKRLIKSEYIADEIAWFDFNALCDVPRAAADYIELARQFHTIILSSVPIMDEYLDDKARRFIYFIDEMYDRSVKVIISADAHAEQLYQGESLKFAFNRTVSRLKEMRSTSYFSRAHQLEIEVSPDSRPIQ